MAWEDKIKAARRDIHLGLAGHERCVLFLSFGKDSLLLLRLLLDAAVLFDCLWFDHLATLPMRRFADRIIQEYGVVE